MANNTPWTAGLLGSSPIIIKKENSML